MHRFSRSTMKFFFSCTPRSRFFLGKNCAKKRTSPPSERSRLLAAPKNPFTPSQQVLLHPTDAKYITKHITYPPASAKRTSSDDSLETEEVCSKRYRLDDLPTNTMKKRCPTTKWNERHPESMSYEDYLAKEEDERQRVHMAKMMKMRKEPWVPAVLMNKYEEVVRASEGFDVPILPKYYSYGSINTFDIKKNSIQELNIYLGAEAALAQFNRKNDTDYKFLEVIKSNHALVCGHKYFVTFVAVARKARRFTTFQAEVWADLRSEVKVTLCRKKLSAKARASCCSCP